MRGPGLRERVCLCIRTHFVAAILAGLVFAVTLAHVPSSVNALNYFDPPKRVLWAALALFLGCASFRSQGGIQRGIRFSLLGVLLWIVGRSLARTRPDIEIEVLMTWLLPGILFGVGLAMDRDRVLKPLAWALLFAGALQAVLMLLQYVGKDPLFADTTAALAYRPGRMIGTVGYQNQAAHFLVVSSVALFVLVRARVARILLHCAVLAVVGLTGNRCGIVALSIAILAVELFAALADAATGKRALLRVTVTFVVVSTSIAGLLAFMPVTRARFARLVTKPKQASALVSRATMARIACAMWKEKPLLGWGAGEFAFQYLGRLKHTLPARKTHETLRHLVFARETHNDYLQFAAEFGLVGLVILVCLVALMLRTLWWAHTKQRTASTGCLFLLSYMLISGMVSFPWQTSLAGPLAALLLGILFPRRYSRSVAVRQLGRLSVARFEHLPYLIASVVLLAWTITEARVNVTLPAELTGGRAARSARTVPTWMHKHHALIGAALARDGTYPAALAELRLAHGGYRDTLLYNNLGHVLSRMGQWQEAVHVYREWAETGIDHAAALKNLAVACEQTGDFEDAAHTLEREMEFHGRYDGDSTARAATLYLRAGKGAAALALIQRYESTHVTNHDTLSAEYHNLAGAVLLAVGDRSAAEHRFQLALQENPELLTARRNLEQLRQENRAR